MNWLRKLNLRGVSWGVVLVALTGFWLWVFFTVGAVIEGLGR